jgi:CheY-like chemotaxis protein
LIGRPINCRPAKIPIIFASAYGQETRLADPHQSALVVSKPYDLEALRMAITKAQGTQAASVDDLLQAQVS